MEIEEILKILNNKDLVIDYLGYNETDYIIDKILRNQELRKKIKNTPSSFWQDVIKNGILVFSDLMGNIKKEEDIITKYLDIEEGRKHIPALVYQKRRKI